MEDFQAKARAAAATFSSMSPPEALAQSLMNDKPTIDSAIKTYMSITAARSWSASGPNVVQASGGIGIGSGRGKDMLKNAICAQADMQESSKMNSSIGANNGGKCFFAKSNNPKMAALLCARTLSKTINSYQIPESAEPIKSKDSRNSDDSLEYEILRILWNGIISNGKKPTSILGRKSLHPIYNMVLEELIKNDALSPVGVDKEEAESFMIEFFLLLDDATKRIDAQEKIKYDAPDDDSCLLWDADVGAAELKRRRDRREKNANFFKNDDMCTKEVEGLTIEEIEDEE